MIQSFRSKAKQKNIVVVVTPGVALLDIAGPCDVFNFANQIAREEKLHPEAYLIIMASATRAHRATTGPGVVLANLIPVWEITAAIDTLIIAGSPVARLEKPDEAFYQWLREAHKKTQRTASVCVGAFVLAKAGILKNQKATTHWEYAKQLQSSFPSLRVDDHLFVASNKRVYTSGGISSGIDLSLKLVEEDLGREIAAKVARKLVVPLRRTGTQGGQFGALLSAVELNTKLASGVKDWLDSNLTKHVTVEQMADQANMSPRNFARVFAKETRLTPGKFLEKLRVEKAKQMLEETDLRLKQISARCGLGSLISMRRTFLRHVSISPSGYRNTFQKSAV
jgi:transcriptional regulator GlxA family with amidase domain